MLNKSHDQEVVAALFDEIGSASNERVEYDEKSAHIIKLDLSGLDLSQIPQKVWHLTHLQTLNLSENRLNLIPPEINLLINLLSLKLMSNRLNQIPS